MFKKILFVCALLWITNNSFADNIHTAIKINNVNINSGLVYVAVYSNETDYKNEQAFVSFIMESTDTILTYYLELPEGEYVVSVFQDKNNWIPAFLEYLRNLSERQITTLRDRREILTS